MKIEACQGNSGGGDALGWRQEEEEKEEETFEMNQDSAGGPYTPVLWIMNHSFISQTKNFRLLLRAFSTAVNRGSGNRGLCSPRRRKEVV